MAPQLTLPPPAMVQRSVLPVRVADSPRQVRLVSPRLVTFVQARPSLSVTSKFNTSVRASTLARTNNNASLPKGNEIRKCLDDSLAKIYKTLNEKRQANKVQHIDGHVVIEAPQVPTSLVHDYIRLIYE